MNDSTQTQVQIRFLCEHLGHFPGEVRTVNTIAAEDLIKRGIANRHDYVNPKLAILDDEFKPTKRTSALIALDIRGMKGLLTYYEKLSDDAWVKQRRQDFQNVIDKHLKLIEELESDVQVLQTSSSPLVHGRQRLEALEHEFHVVRSRELAEESADEERSSPARQRRPRSSKPQFTGLERQIRSFSKIQPSVDALSIVFGLPADEIQAIINR